MRRAGGLQVGVVAALLLAPGLAARSAEEPVAVELRVPRPSTHYLEVEATYPTAGTGSLELWMAVWTPGSYLVREFSRNVEAVTAATDAGAPLPVEKVSKNRWRVAGGGAQRVRVHYRVYCREMSVRTCWIDADLGVLNGAPIYLVPDGPFPGFDVRLHRPPGWQEVVTALPAHPDGEPDHYLAQDLDQLMDCPLVGGKIGLYPFTVEEVPHLLANVGEGGVWDGPRSARDVETIVREQVRFWGVVPYDRFLFLNVLSEAGGGLEHRTSTLLMTSRWKTRRPEDYRSWLGLVSHELFHAWNGKRLRPRALGPFDYEREAYTPSLWIVEGLTSYYDDLLLCRAGLLGRRDYLKRLSGSIRGVQTTPGRQVRSLEEASLDAWLKHYRPDENSPNSTISYYGKGAVVGFLLDARVRQATGGERSLDDVLRRAYSRYSGPQGYTAEEFRQVAEEVAQVDLKEWFRRHASSTEELDYAPALEWFGLRFRPRRPPDPESNPGPAWLGLETRVEEGRLRITGVIRGTPGDDAGLQVGDEILAVDGYRVPPDGWDTFRARFAPGDRVVVLVARRERLTLRPAVFGEQPPEGWNLEIDPDAPSDRKARRNAWLRAR